MKKQNQKGQRKWWQWADDQSVDAEDADMPVSYADKWGGLAAWSGWSGNGVTTKLRDITRATARIVRVANSVLNNGLGMVNGVEEKLAIGWASDGGSQSNDTTNSVITLNPNLITSPPTGLSQEVAIDGAAGSALLQATLKRTSQDKAYDCHAYCRQADERRGTPVGVFSQGIVDTYRAVETAIAKRALLEEWPGASDYMARYNKVIGATEAATVQDFVQRADNRLEAACAALQWSLVNPNQPLAIGEDLQGLIDSICEDAPDAEDRLNYAKHAVTRLREYCDDHPEPEPPPPPSQPQPSEDEDKDKDEEESKRDKPDPKDGEENEDKGEGGDEPSEGGDKPDKEDESKGEGDKNSDDGGGESDKPDAKPKGDGKDGKPDESDGADDEGKGSPSSPSKAPERPVPSKPKIVDGQQFGEVIPAAAKEEVPEDFDLDGDITMLERPIPPDMCGEQNISVLKMKPTHACQERYATLKREVRPLMESVVKSLHFRKELQGQAIYGLRSGGLDEGSLHKLKLREPQPAIFERKDVKSMPDVAIAILVDESGSMVCIGRRSGGQPRFEDAKRVCIALVEAFRRLVGLKLSVYGHDHYGCNTVNFRHYLTPEITEPHALCQIWHRYNNADGFAVQETIKQLHKNYPDVRQRIVFVLSDGMPSASNYDGESAMDHIHDVCTWGEKKFRIKTYGIGIGGMPSQEEGLKMYGAGRFVVLGDVLGSARIVANFVARAASSE